LGAFLEAKRELCADIAGSAASLALMEGELAYPTGLKNPKTVRFFSRPSKKAPFAMFQASRHSNAVDQFTIPMWLHFRRRAGGGTGRPHISMRSRRAIPDNGRERGASSSHPGSLQILSRDCRLSGAATEGVSIAGTSFSSVDDKAVGKIIGGKSDRHAIAEKNLYSKS